MSPSMSQAWCLENFKFCDNYRCTGSCKEMDREVPCAVTCLRPCRQLPRHHRADLRPGTIPGARAGLAVMRVLGRVCMPACPCDLITPVASCGHHNQDIQLDRRKTPGDAPIPTSPPSPLTPGHRSSVLAVVSQQAAHVSCPQWDRTQRSCPVSNGAWGQPPDSVTLGR